MPQFFCALLSLVFTSLLLSCSTSRSAILADDRVYVKDVQFVADKVLVVFLDMESAMAHIRGAKLVDGYFRPLGEDLRQEEIVRIQYLDANNRILMEKVLDNPLIQYKEYDENGKIKRVRIEEKKGSMLLRSQHSEAIKMIRVEYGSDRTFKTIATLPLEITS